jgi:hypothetical protein
MISFVAIKRAQEEKIAVLLITTMKLNSASRAAPAGALQ